MGLGGISPWALMFFILLIPVALLPTIIALVRNHPYKLWIILVNIFGGLLGGIGWLVALVWSFILPKEKTKADTAVEIQQLHELKEKGILTQQEFDLKKKSLLNS